MEISYLHEPHRLYYFDVRIFGLDFDFDFIRIDDMQSPNETVFELSELNAQKKNESNRIEWKSICKSSLLIQCKYHISVLCKQQICNCLVLRYEE